MSVLPNNTESNRIENWMHDLHSWASEKISRDTYVDPAVVRTIYIEQVEVVYNEEINLESWMVIHFESRLAEDIEIEDWMASA